jgi:uncharacterized ParB-like nuclease family protein
MFITKPIISAVFYKLVLSALAFMMCSANGQSTWVDSQRTGNEARFLFGSQIRRYDLVGRTWLPSIALPRAGATAMAVDGQGAMVAYGTTIYRYAPDFTNEAATGTTSSAIQSLFLDGNLVIAVHSSGLYARITIFHRTTGAQLSTREAYVDSMYGASHAPQANRLYGRTQGISPADIVSSSYTDAGVVAGVVGSPYHGSYPGAAKTWVFPNESRVVDSSGTVYGAEGLPYVGSLAGTVTDIAFNGDVPIVLRGGEVIAFTNTLVETGRAPAGSTTGGEIQVAGGEAFVFSPGITVPTLQVIPLSSLNAPEPGTPIDPNGLAYVVDDSFQNENGDLLLFNKAAMSLFRWSPSERSYTGTFPLVGIPKYAAYSKTGRAAYFAYDSGLVRRMDFTSATPKETALFNLPSSPGGLATAGEFVFSHDSSGAWGTHYVHSPAGALLDSEEWNRYSRVWDWDPVKRRMYFFRDSSSPNDLHWEAISTTGQITGEGETPYHGDFTVSPPIRVSPDGGKVIIGSGVVFETTGMTKTASLANGFTDAVWVGDRLYSIRLINGITQVQSWQGTQLLAGPEVRQFNGTPLRIFGTSGKLTLVTSHDGAPRFIQLSEQMEILYQSPVKPARPVGPLVTARDDQSVALQWQDVSDNEDGFRIEYRVGSSSWLQGATAPADATNVTVKGLAYNTVHEFRIVALAGTLASEPSPIVSARTTSGPDEPVGEPYLLEITRVFNNRITLVWRDNANNESGFRILRSTTAGGSTVALDAPANARSFTDTNLTANTTYYYRIQVVNGAITGDLSAQVTARTLSSASAPSSPYGLKATADSPNAVTLTWTDNSTNEDGFIIERSGNPATIWTEISRVDYNITGHTDPTVQPDTSYSYRVRAWNAAGASSNSTVAITTPKLGGEFAGHSIRVGDRYYFAFTGPHRIERYDLAARKWLPPITLQAAATALWADEAGIYAAEDRTVIRFAPDGGGRTALANAEATVNALFTLGGTLVLQNGSSHTSVDKTTGIILASYERPYFVYGNHFVTSGRRAYFRSSYGVGFVEVGTDGKLVTSGQSAYTSGSVNYNRLTIFPNGSRIAADGGTVFDTEALAYNNSLGSAFTDLSFHGNDIPIVLRADKLVAYGNNLLEAGSATLPAAGLRVAVNGNDAVVFSLDGRDPHGLGVGVVSLSQLSAPQPGAAIDPRGLAYTPDEVFVDRDGTLLLFNKAQLSLFRWSPTARDYLPTVPLLGAPSFAAYSPENHAAYFAYASQVVRKLDLAAANPVETPLFNLPAASGGLTTAGRYLYVVANGIKTFTPSGEMISNGGFTYYYGSHNVWDPVKRRVYHFRDGSSPNDLHYDTISDAGAITGSGETPYHGDFSATKPIRVSPDGTKVVIGSGVVFNADGLTKAANLANGFTDAVWSGEKLITLREINGLSQLQTWEGAQFLPGSGVRQFNGTPLRIFNTSQGLLLITSVQGAPRFTLLDAAFNPVFISPTRPVAPSGLAATDRTVDSVSLQWTDNSDNEDSFRVEYRVGAGAWNTGATAGAGATSATVTGLPSNTTFEFRVLAVTGTLDSTASSSVTVRTLSSPDEPAGEPYNLRITRIFRNSVTLEWQDNGDNETGFRILRSTTADGAATVFTAPAGATSFTSTGLAASSTYYYRIQIENGAITGDLSSQVSGTTRSSDAAPAQPSSLTASTLSPTSVRLKWTDASTNEDGFKIERSTNPVTTWTPLGSVTYNADSFTDITATPDTQYTYRVAAFNSTGTSSYRNVTATTPALGGTFTGFAMRSGDVHYFACSGPNRIERYDLMARAWLQSVPLNATATALWVDESGIFVAEDRAVVRFSPDGGNRTPMGNAQSTVESLFTLKNILAFAPSGGDFVTLNKTTGIFLSNFSYWYTGSGFSVVPNLNRVYFRSTNVSPSDIHYLEFDAAGKFVTGKDSPYHGAYPTATRTFVFPNGARVADDSGTVYSTDSLAYTNSLAGAFTDLAFHGTDIPIVLRGNKLTSYTNTLLEAGSFTLTAAGLRVAVDGQDAVVFISDGASPRGLRVETVSLTKLAAPKSGAPIDPNGLPYAIDDAFADKDGNLLLFSKAQLSLFRWSPAKREYTGSFPLIGVPDYAAYSAQNHSAYFAYASQIVRKMDLGAADPVETPLFSLPQKPSGLATAGEFIFAADPSGAWSSHYVFSPSGSMLQSVEWNYYSRVWDWDPAKRRMYFFRDDTSPNDLHYETIDAAGKITGEGETPYHGEFTVTPPIRVSPDGSKVVIGSGIIFETTGMTKLGTTPFGFADPLGAFTDAEWWNGKLLTIHASGARTQIRRWDAKTLVELASLPLVSGTPVRLLALNAQNIALITTERSVPRIQLLNQNLEVIHTFISTPVAAEDTPFTWTPAFEWSTLGTGTLTVSAPVLPDWLVFSNGVLRGTPLEADSGDQVNRSESHRIVLRAVNSQNQTEEREFPITALWRNDPPVLPETTPRIAANDKGEDIQFNMGTVLTDPDEKDVHHWSIAGNSNPSIFSDLRINDDGILDMVFAPYVSGTSTVAIDVADAAGESARTTVEIKLPDLPAPRVTLDSMPTLSRLTGLYEQKITVTNVAARAIAGFDLFISGLRAGVSLYNGTGTGEGGGIIAYHRPLEAAESVTMVLEYFASPRGTIPSPVISAAVATPQVQSLAARSGTAPAFAVNRLVKQSDGSVVIEFNAVPGKLYGIQYSTDVGNWKSCPVPIRAGGTKVQWIDRGPPWTDVPPSSSAQRFYRVRRLEN